MNNKVLSLMDHDDEKEPTLQYGVTCPWCLSDNTKPANLKYLIFECEQCGEVFNYDYDNSGN